MKRPPVVAALLLRICLPRDAYDAVAGDLDESWHEGALSRRRYWRLALASMLACAAARKRGTAGTPRIAADPRKGERGMRSLAQDVVYGARLLRRNPGFTAAAVATLALGIGANSAIFSVVNVVSLQPLAYHDSQNVALLRAFNVDTGAEGFALRLPDFVELRRQSTVLDDVAAYAYWSASLTGGDMPERAQAYHVTANTFELLGVMPLLGRGFLPEEGVPGGPNAAVLSHGLWVRRFGADPSVVGRDITLDGRAFTIVGVMPRRFEFPVFNFKGDLWAPMQIDPDAVLAGRSTSPSAVVIARVRAEAGYAAAQAEVDAIMRRLAAEYPDTNRSRGARVIELGRLDDEVLAPALLIVAATVAVILVLACANVANLLLARGTARQRELAVRAALGAGRWRLARQMIVESLLIGAAGGAAGLVLAFFALDALRAALPEIVWTTMPNVDALRLDRATLSFTAGLSLLASLLFGLAPAWSAVRGQLQGGLRESGAAGGSRGNRRLRASLVVLQVALSTALLATAGLLVKSYQRQLLIDPGFDARQVLTMTISLPDNRYASQESRLRFFEEAARRVSEVPGVSSAGFVNVLPFSTYNRGTRFTIDDVPPPEPGREPGAAYRVVTTGYFDALRIPLRRGRLFDSRDRLGGDRVVIVNDALVRRHFGGHDPIGSRVHLGRSDTPESPTIVGVVGDVRHDEITETAYPEIYLPAQQAPQSMMMLAARTAGDPGTFAQAVRTAIQAVDPEQPVYHVKPLQQSVDESLVLQVSAAGMTGLFSIVALVLAAVGTYGVLSYAVGQQQREFGVRLALGARPRDLLALVVSRGLRLVLSGAALGVACALGVTRLMAGILYGVRPADPSTYLAVSAAIALVGVVACGIPAWRASRTEPMAALRVE
ncbi:MAG TPA: ABC transporter permease [Vicinamibacterales bacterium]|nr:ABC transporter permease [Vicinamibacterales bacterium]